MNAITAISFFLSASTIVIMCIIFKINTVSESVSWKNRNASVSSTGLGSLSQLTDYIKK